MPKYSILQYPKNPKVGPNWPARGDALRFFIHSVANHQKVEGGPFGKKYFEKSLTMPKKIKEGPFGFFNILSVAKHQKTERTTLWRNFFQNKSLAMPKTERGTLQSLPISNVTRKEEKPSTRKKRKNPLRGKRGKTHLVQFARPNYSIWDHEIS